MTDQRSVNPNVRNIAIRRTWIQELVESIQAENAVGEPDKAYQSLVYSILFNVGIDQIPPEDIVDAGQDKQIDIIRIDDDEDLTYAHIHIIQTKNHPGFSSDAIIKLRNGLDWIFVRPHSEYSTINNVPLVNKIDEIRQLRLRYGAGNLALSVYFVTNGDTEELSQEYIQERRTLITQYENAGFNEFQLFEIGAFELINLINQTEQERRTIDLDIPIIYDINRASIIDYTSGDTRAIVCTVSGRALAQIASSEPRDAIFDLNVRPFYGSRGRVNSEILVTCGSDEATRFWFLNNGITMICDRFDKVLDPDNPVIKIYNAQIVNGCQTSVTLREALEAGTLRDEVRVLLRIYQTDNQNLSQRITLTTNNQNRITDRDLRANDLVQVDIQRIMYDRYGYFYERKNKQFRLLQLEQRKRVIPNYRAAQAYLAIVRKKPSIARGYLGKIWSDHYLEIFNNATVEDLLASYLIYKYCQNRANLYREELAENVHEVEIGVYGAFHLSRIIGYLIQNNKWGKNHIPDIADLIKRIEQDDNIISQPYETAMQILLEIWRIDYTDNPNPLLYFKAGDVQKTINQEIERD